MPETDPSSTGSKSGLITGERTYISYSPFNRRDDITGYYDELCLTPKAFTQELKIPSQFPSMETKGPETRARHESCDKTDIQQLSLWLLTMVRKSPNSGFIVTLSPSVKIKDFFRSFLHVRIMEICWAATDRTGKSIRLNSSKQPQDPDCASPSEEN